MVRTVALAFDQANRTNDYTALSALGTKRFQTENGPGKPSQEFAGFRSGKVDLSRVAEVAPRLTGSPGLKNDSITVTGVLPGASELVTFDLSFEPDGRRWTMSKMAFSFTPAIAPAP